MGYVVYNPETNEYISQYTQHDGFFTKDLQKAQVFRREKYTRKFTNHRKYSNLFGSNFYSLIQNMDLIAVPVEVTIRNENNK